MPKKVCWRHYRGVPSEVWAQFTGYWKGSNEKVQEERTHFGRKSDPRLAHPPQAPPCAVLVKSHEMIFAMGKYGRELGDSWEGTCPILRSFARSAGPPFTRSTTVIIPPSRCTNTPIPAVTVDLRRTPQIQSQPIIVSFEFEPSVAPVTIKIVSKLDTGGHSLIHLETHKVASGESGMDRQETLHFQMALLRDLYRRWLPAAGSIPVELVGRKYARRKISLHIRLEFQRGSNVNSSCIYSSRIMCGPLRDSMLPSSSDEASWKCRALH